MSDNPLSAPLSEDFYPDWHLARHMLLRTARLLAEALRRGQPADPCRGELAERARALHALEAEWTGLAAPLPEWSADIRPDEKAVVEAARAFAADPRPATAATLWAAAARLRMPDGLVAMWSWSPSEGHNPLTDDGLDWQAIPEGQ